MFVNLKDLKCTLGVQGFEYDTQTLAGFMLTAANEIAVLRHQQLKVGFYFSTTHNMREGEHANSRSTPKEEAIMKSRGDHDNGSLSECPSATELSGEWCRSSWDFSSPARKALFPKETKTDSLLCS
jgi:hypothetical protein